MPLITTSMLTESQTSSNASNSQSNNPFVNSGVVGLPNLKDATFSSITSTSYMNSVIQCLAHTVDMKNVFLFGEEYHYEEQVLCSGI